MNGGAVMMFLPLLLLIPWTNGHPSGNVPETDGEASRKILGSSVVTSVSVIMDTANGTQIIDAVGKPVGRPSGTHVASPINLLNPDRYEFFTFDDNGELVKRLMTLEEIQSIIANGDGEDVNYNSGMYLPEKKVNDVVSNVQSVLKEQILSHKNTSDLKPMLDTPDVTSTWSMILPAIFSNNGDSVGPDKMPLAVTADTIMVEVPTQRPQFTTTLSPEITTKLKTTTTATTTTTTTTTARPTTSSTTISFEKLSTEQYIGNMKSTSERVIDVKPTVQEEIKETEPSINKDTPIITVTIIADSKYDTNMLPNDASSPIVSILPIEEESVDILEKIITSTPASTLPNLTSPIRTSTVSTTRDIPTSTTTLSSTLVTSTTTAPSPTTSTTTTTLSPTTVTTTTTTTASRPTTTTTTTASIPTTTTTTTASRPTTTTTTTSSRPTTITTTTAPIPEEFETEKNEKLTTTMEPIKIQAYAPLTESLLKTIYPQQKYPIASNDVSMIETTTTKMDQVILLQDISEKTPIESEPTDTNVSDIEALQPIDITTEKVLEPEKTVVVNPNEKLTPQLINENTEEEAVSVESVKDEVMLVINEEESLNQEPEVEETSSEASSEIIQTSASSSLSSNLKSTTPILLIIQENPITEKLSSQSSQDISSEKPILSETSSKTMNAEQTTSKISITTLEDAITTTPEPAIKTDKPSTIKIIYLTEKTVANILSSTNQPSSTTPITVSIPEEISTISKLIVTTEKPNTVKIIPLTEKLITTLTSISLPNESPVLTTVAYAQQDGSEELSTLSFHEEKEEITTIQPENYGVTSEVEDTIYNKAVTESLNQLLLFSTNIYEINTQLAGVTAAMDAEAIADATELNENETVEIDQTTQIYTTENSLMSSIQELISQTVNDADVEEQILNFNANNKVEGILTNINTKPMINIQQEAATAGSTLMHNFDEEIQENTEEETKDNSSTESDESLKLSEAMSSVLSQIFAENSADVMDDTTVIEKHVNDTISELPKIIEITTVADYNTASGLKNKEENETLSEENITAESSQTIVTEIDNNNNDLNGETTVSKNEDIAPELESNVTNNSEVLPSDVYLSFGNDTEIVESTTIIIDLEQNTTKEYASDINEEDKEEDLIKYEAIPPVFGQKIKIQPPKITTEPPVLSSTQVVVTNTEKADEIEQLKEYETQENYEKINTLNVTVKQEYTTPNSVLTSTVTVVSDNFNNQSDTSTELQPVKKIKVDDILDAVPPKPIKLSQNSEPTKLPSADMKLTVDKLPLKDVSSTLKPLSSTPSLPLRTTTMKTITTAKPLSENKNVVTSIHIEEGLKNTSWTLVSTILPHANSTAAPPEPKPVIASIPTIAPVKLSQQSLPGFGLESTTSKLDTDIYQFVELCNELSFGFWNAVNNGISSARSVFVSPFAATSLLAMVFLGARGATSGEMNEILKLDDMVTFNPHLIFKNVSESIEMSKSTGVAVSVMARELYSDRSRGKLLSFYKERARQFYDGHVEEINFKEVGDVVRRRTNLIVKKYTSGKISEYLKDNTITMRPPLAGISASVFQTDCSNGYTDGRDGELHFVVLPSIRQRRLVPVPAVVFRTGFLAGYDPILDATAAAIGTQEQIVSTILIIPGQQGIAAAGDGLARLEKQLSETAFKKGTWTRLLRTLIPRPGLELQIPRFSHKSVINATVALKRMGLKDLFTYDKADLRGLNGVAHELHLSDILQLNTFTTCGESPINTEQHHSEIYPATSRRPYRRTKKLGHYISDSPFGDFAIVGEEPRDYQRAFHDPLHDASLLALPLPLRPRQARIPDAPRLRFDRPFLFYVRHNPTGLILHMGRFNPRLLP